MGGHRRRVKSGPSWHCGSLGESPGASLHPRPLTAPWAVSPVLCQAQRARLVSLGASEVGVIRPILRMGVNEAPRPARPDPMQGPPSHFPSGLTSAAPGRAFPRAEAGSAGPECLFRPGRAPGRRGGNGRKMFVQLGGGGQDPQPGVGKEVPEEKSAGVSRPGASPASPGGAGLHTVGTCWIRKPGPHPHPSSPAPPQLRPLGKPPGPAPWNKESGCCSPPTMPPRSSHQLPAWTGQ